MSEFTPIPGERWLPTVYCLTMCMVSDFGRMHSLDRSGRKDNRLDGEPITLRGRLLTPHADQKTGRSVVRMIIGIVYKQLYVADHVLHAFVGRGAKNYVARYRSGDLSDCRLENLYWGLPSDYCPLGHRLEIPNWVPNITMTRAGKYICLSCHRAKSTMLKSERDDFGSYEAHFKFEADMHYSALIEEPVGGAWAKSRGFGQYKYYPPLPR